uniref:Uncharacterized protein n=1 Tax=Brassica campestris TaxID=3711 RepID=M4F1N6_BRACM
MLSKKTFTQSSTDETKSISFDSTTQEMIDCHFIVSIDTDIKCSDYLMRESCRGDEGTSIDGAPLVSIDEDSRTRAKYISRLTLREKGGTPSESS